MNKSIVESAERLSAELSSFVASLLDRDDRTDESARSEQIKTPFSTMTQTDWAEAIRLWNQVGRPMIGELAGRHCPACGSDGRHRQLFESYDGYPYVECRDCGCWHVPLLVDASLFERFFSHCPQAREVASRSFKLRLTDDNRNADLIRFNEYFDVLVPMLDGLQHRRYLDVGCGLGNSLLAAREHGLDPIGVESSIDCIRLGRQAGIEIRHIREPLPTGTFGLISFWESLEHIDDPSAALSKCDALLAEDGLIAFSVPNLDSPLVRAQRADCSIMHGGYDTPGHVNLFGPDHLRRLLDRSGFELIYLDGQYGMSLLEFASYMLGSHKGAYDLLRGAPIDHGLSRATVGVLEAIGPAAALLERATLTTPILFGIACRAGLASRFGKAVATLEARRKETLTRQAAALSPSIASRESMIERLQRDLADRGAAVDQAMQEISKRDNLLMLTQGEVDRRDRMLSEQAAEVDKLHAEISKRDDLLADVQAEVARRDRLLAEQATELDRLHGEVSGRDSLLTASQNVITRHDDYIASLQTQVDYFDKRNLSRLIRGLCSLEDWLRGKNR